MKLRDHEKQPSSVVERQGEVPTMKIAVCVKQVPDTWAEKTLSAADSTLDRAAADGVLNELDEYAVEEAL